MTNEKIIKGDCLDKLKEIGDNTIDSIVTDPPYGYSFMGKDWDTFKATKQTKSQVVTNLGSGMKKTTQQQNKEYQDWVCEWGKECLRVVKPGSFMFFTMAPRQDLLYRAIAGLEDAGWDVSFTSIYWAYASGFPKAHNISKTIDKRNGKSGKVVGEKGTHANNTGCIFDTEVNSKRERQENLVVEPESSDAVKFKGAYGGFQPKPATEIIIVVMKPITKSFTDQALDNGKGLTWLDDCRVPYESENDKDGCGFGNRKHTDDAIITFGNTQEGEIKANPSGRFPANLLCSDDILNDNSDHPTATNQPKMKLDTTTKFHGLENDREYKNYGDSGSFSRYFDLDKWFAQNLPESVKRTFPYIIVPKASKSEKNMGLDEFEKKQPKGRDVGQDVMDIPHKRRPIPTRNQHPTVKPVKLFAYLITMGSREGDIILDPFMGSGTTGIASKLLNRNFIGIELSQEYIDIASPRMEAYEEYRRYIIDKPNKSQGHWPRTKTTGYGEFGGGNSEYYGVGPREDKPKEDHFNGDNNGKLKIDKQKQKHFIGE